MSIKNKTPKKYIATICSPKGGVGKTTLTANMAAFLSELGLRVLLIDADKQPSLSSFFPIKYRAPDGFVSLVMENNLDSTISTTTVGCDIVINDDTADQLSNWIINAPGAVVRLKILLKRLQSTYDIILIDTQGAVGTLQDIGVLAGDFMISPIMPETISAKEFARGTLAMLQRLEDMANLGAPLGSINCIIYRKDRTTVANQIHQQLIDLQYNPSYGNIRFLNTVVPSLSVYTKAATEQIPVHQYEQTRSGPTESALTTLKELTKEIFPHLSGAIDKKFSNQGG